MQNGISATDLFYVLNGDKITTDIEKKRLLNRICLQHTKGNSCPCISVLCKVQKKKKERKKKDLITLRASIIEE